MYVRLCRIEGQKEGFQVILTSKILLYKRKRSLTKNSENAIPKSELKLCICTQYGRLYIIQHPESAGNLVDCSG